MTIHHTQKVILITGCSSGFGLLFAARLSAQGHFVYATMRDLSKQHALLDEVQERNGQVFIRRLDVTHPETIAEVINEIQSHHGHIDVVINNAGYGLGGYFEDLEELEIREQMDVNFFGVQNVCRQVLPLMRARKQGTIINISSIAGQTATPCLGAYNASKWALEGFSESLYYEVEPFGIKVILVEPGSYPTKIFSDNARYGKNYDNPQSPYYPYSQKLKAFVVKFVRQAKADPEDVARLVERIVQTARPRLRYPSSISAWFRIKLSKLFPPWVYMKIYRKVVYGKINGTL